MKISVPALFVASENDARDFSVGAFIEVSVCRCELHTSKTQFVSQAYAARHIAIELFGEHHHPLIVGEDLANPNARSDVRMDLVDVRLCLLATIENEVPTRQLLNRWRR